MAATQQLPSWMTLATIVYTNAAGQTVTTETTLQLPLTYYGPSIPLGSDGAWTYGGLTTPAPSTSSLPTTSTTISFTPTSSTPTSSATPTSSSSSFKSSSTSSTSSSSSTSATSTPYSNATTLSKGALIGIIIGAIALFVVLLLLFIWFVRWNSRRRDSRAITPIWTGWNVLTPDPTGDEESRPAGVGSPRDSGDEASSFLRQSTSAPDVARRSRPVSSLPPGAAPPHNMGSTGSDRTRSSQASTDYGVVVPGSGHFGQAYNGDGFPARFSREMAGYIVAPGELLCIEDEEEPEEILPPRMYSPSHPSLPDHITPLLPPPPFEGAATRKPSDRSLLNEKEKSVRSASYPTSEFEDSKVFTARRVRVQELGPRSPQDDDSTNTEPVPGPSSWRNSVSRLRRSWFGSSSSRSASRPSSRKSDKDAEAAQSLLGRRLGVAPAGERPMSGVSAKSAVSGNTVYHDAVSRIGTPVSLPSRAITPGSQRGSAAFPTDFAPPVPSGAPPAYDDPYDLIGSRNPSPLSPTGVDVLDIPAPAPFSSASTRGTPLPPGLVPLSSRRAWRDSLSVITGSSNDAGITIDVLDAEPPRAGDGWRSLAGGSFLGGSAGPDPNERRTTFGIPQLIHQGNPMVSERGSLHSMRSHLSPYSARSSSGSAPASSARLFNLSGSNSSRPSANSAQSRIATTSSGSLNSSRPLGPISPSVSAFGMSHIEEYEDPYTEPGSRTSFLGPMPSFTSHSVLSQPTIRSVGATTVTSDDTEVTRTTITSGSDDMTSTPLPWFQEPLRAEI